MTILKKSITKSKCRFCANVLEFNVVNLGMSPLCQKHVKKEHENDMEKFFPLHVYVCHNCWLMQLEEFATPAEIFEEDYGYFSSYSDTWLEHARIYTELVINRFRINSKSLVVEIASNDGYLLQWFVKKGIPVLGIDPAANVAKAAQEKGVGTEVQFFGWDVAVQLSKKSSNEQTVLLYRFDIFSVTFNKLSLIFPFFTSPVLI